MIELLNQTNIIINIQIFSLFGFVRSWRVLVLIQVLALRASRQAHASNCIYCSNAKTATM